jgi:hypothetical protein
VGKGLVVGAGLLLSIGLAAVGSVAAGDDNAWRCEPESVGRISSVLLDGGGYASQEEAIDARIPSFAEDTDVPLDQLEEAFSSTDGPDRYDPREGLLFIDDQLQARMGLAKLNDGTWVVGSAEMCMGKPKTEPGVTPSPPMEDAGIE